MWSHRSPHKFSDIELYHQASTDFFGVPSTCYGKFDQSVFDALLRNGCGLMLFRDPSSSVALVMVRLSILLPSNLRISGLRELLQILRASIPVQSHFSVGDFVLDNESVTISAFVDSEIPETVSHGLSGKCSWSPYHSLAVCHQCIDISDQTQIKDTYFYQNRWNVSPLSEML